uniref:Uncharacterized protein n=1 Tax=Tetradesmus obliquus TaxID=3088 RepID=A0A383V828_TETOB|eukprot:jgi/Sobl393_1/17816/SZX61737.1
MPSNTSLSLNRKLQNPQFESWKLGSDFAKKRVCLHLPGLVYQGAGDAVDFLHTKASVLRNHLIESQGHLFVATSNHGQSVVINALVSGASGDVQLLPLADIPAASHDPLLGIALEAALDCSLAVLQAPTAAAAPQPAGGSQAAAAGTAGPGGTAAAAGMMLVSTGKGDLLLLQQAQDGSMVPSQPVFPLRPRPPSVGVRPFTIEAGWLAPTGHIRAVLSALRTLDSSSSSSSSGARAPAGQLRGVCELWLVTLQASPPPAAAGSSEQRQQQQQQQAGHVQQQQAGHVLQVVSSQLLMLSKGPPAAALAAAAAAGADGGGCEALLLVGEPALEEDELPAGYAAGAAPAKSEAAPRAPLAFTAAQDQPAGSTANGTAGAAAAAAAAAAAGLDEDMDIDPRTLQQAAARLAQFSSQEALGELPQQQWTDVFKESGPGDSLSDAELAVDVMLFTPAAAAAATDADGAAASSSPALQPLALASCVSCAPHRLLAVAASAPGSSGQAQPGLLLGLSDDVDCALVSAQLSSPGEMAAAGSSSSSSSSSTGGWGVALCHQAYLPALAYVVSGKTQRRHLLLGDSCSPVCGVLVEGQKYAYLYGQPSAQQQHGQQQILDMELPAGSRVLGARLLQGRGSGAAAAAANGGAASQGASTTACLLLLTSSELICYTLQGP